jgi:DNA-binding GntR family transcriptional regulator
MASVVRAPSRTQQVYSRLRSDILGGRYEPGAPLRLAELATRFDVGMSVMREALIRLAEQHLVTLLPNQGFRVTEISQTDLHNLTELRVTLEGLALRRSIEHAPVEWEGAVISAHHVLDRATYGSEDGPGTTTEWSAAHAAFHDALGSGCGNPRLIAMTHSLRDGAELYRQLASRSTVVTRDVAAEHRELMDLATTRRADEAVAALSRHLSLTTEILLRTILKDPPADLERKLESSVDSHN